MIDNTKSQQEIAGFVIIVAVVTIIGIVFLSLMFMRGGENTQTSAEISSFLMSGLYSTSECYVNNMLNLEDLAREVNRNPGLKCENGKNAILVLNQTFSRLIEEGLLISDNSPNKAFKLNIYYIEQNISSSKKTIIYSEKGKFTNCSQTLGGKQITSSLPGTVNFELEVCKSS